MIPQAALKLGFKRADQMHPARRRLLIGSEGPADSGKTEFVLSIPGPGVILCLDRGYEAMLDNPHPPASRRIDEYAFKTIEVPLAGQSRNPEFYRDYWKSFYELYKAALLEPSIHVICVDGDSDSWELQRLAQWAKLTQVMPRDYAAVNAARRVMYARAYDSGKTVVATNKIKKDYEDVILPDGTIKMGDDGRPAREWYGNYKRQGFDDQDYLFQVQLRHLRRDKEDGSKEWGIKILKCKADMDLVGFELWGEDCNFAGLVQTIYPHIDLGEWGF